jgi:hypothetical protein
MESMDDTLMGKHTAHHLQQIERDLYDLLEKEKEQIIEAWMATDNSLQRISAEEYYNETYK